MMSSPSSMPRGLNEDDRRRLQRLDRLAGQLDESIRIPGIGYRVGYDALIGLIPGVGDIAGLLLSTYIVIEAARFRIPKTTLMRMMANAGIEALIGTVPVIGDAFDAVYKANLRNMRLLRKRLDDRAAKPIGDRVFFTSILLVPLALLVAVAALLLFLLSLL